MSAVVHHVLLTLSILALGLAAIRVADRTGARGLERAIGAVVVAVALAVTEALVLGLVGLGSNTAALAVAAALTWAAATRLLPAPELRVAGEVSTWWRGVPTPWRFLAAAGAGTYVAWAAWLLLHPSIGFDSSVYHYVEIGGWVTRGRPGSVLHLSYEFPFGNYPLTDEVALTWAAGIARSFVPLSLWAPEMLLLLGGAGWVTLRNLAVDRVAAALGTAVLVTAPIAVRQLSEHGTDLQALTWLACTAALCSGVKRTPRLMTLALLAGGLAVGTKTTPAILVLAAVCVTAYRYRATLLPLWRWLIAALAGAFVVGGVWYARNLFQHGSPFWPFAPAPWGDPRPAFLKLVDTRFLQRPQASFDAIRSYYGRQLAGGILVLGAIPFVLLAGVLRTGARRWQLMGAAGITIVAFLAWSLAPGTGLPRAPGLFNAFGWPLSTLRYLLPAIGAGTLAVALATRERGVAGVLATLVLAGALVWDIVIVAGLGRPFLPSVWTLAAGAAGGILLLGLASLAARTGRSLPGRGVAARAALAVSAAVAVGIVLAPAGNGYLKRFAAVKKSSALGLDVVGWFVSQPGLANGHLPVAFGSRTMLAGLTGDHFTHRLELIGPETSCAQVRTLARTRIVVLSTPEYLHGFLGILPFTPSRRCLSGTRPAYQDSGFAVYVPS